MNCRKCGGPAVVLVPVITVRVAETVDSAYLGSAALLAPEYEGRCEQCLKAEKMTDDVPEIEDGAP